MDAVLQGLLFYLILMTDIEKCDQVMKVSLLCLRREHADQMVAGHVVRIDQNHLLTEREAQVGVRDLLQTICIEQPGGGMDADEFTDHFALETGFANDIDVAPSIATIYAFTGRSLLISVLCANGWRESDDLVSPLT